MKTALYLDLTFDSGLSIIFPDPVQIYDEASVHHQQQRDHSTPDLWAQPDRDTRYVFGAIKIWQEPHPSPLLVMIMMIMIMMIIVMMIIIMM